MREKSHAKCYIFAILALIILGALDQYTKVLAVSHLMDGPFVLFTDIFELRYLENRGSAFGMLQNKRIFLLLISVVVMAIGTFYFVKLPWNNKMMKLRILIVFILAGGLGNMIDRIRLGYVIDFFYFKLINFPIFNVADIYVTVSIILLFILIIFFFKEDELNDFILFGKKNNHE